MLAHCAIGRSYRVLASAGLPPIGRGHGKHAPRAIRRAPGGCGKGDEHAGPLEGKHAQAQGEREGNTTLSKQALTRGIATQAPAGVRRTA